MLMVLSERLTILRARRKTLLGGEGHADVWDGIRRESGRIILIRSNGALKAVFLRNNVNAAIPF